MKDLNKLSKEIFEANKAKGFHEEEHSVEHMLCLVISELMEAVEADRKGRRADMEHYVDILGSPAHKNGISNEDWSHLFQHTIKDTVEDELADAVIRLLDTAGAMGFDVSGGLVVGGISEHALTTDIYFICQKLTNIKITLPHRLTVAVSYIERLCEMMEIDLWKHVELKLKYNSLRPHKHGKKY